MTESQPKKNWRYYLGLTLFIVHLILPLLALIFVPMLGVSEGVGAVLFGLSVAGGPDVLLIASAALLGKDNLQYLFSSLGRGVKNLVKWDQVSKGRYRLGLWMLGIGFFVTPIMFYVFPETLSNGDQPDWGFYVTVGADILFVLSILVLGAPFWAKLTSLFRYDARVVTDNEEEEAPAT